MSQDERNHLRQNRELNENACQHRLIVCERKGYIFEYKIVTQVFMFISGQCLS